MSVLLEGLPLLELCRIEGRQRDAGASGEKQEGFHKGYATVVHHPGENVAAFIAIEAMIRSLGDVHFEAQSALTLVGRVPALAFIASPCQRGMSRCEEGIIDHILNEVGVTD